jgi:serine/threonine protein kinase
MAFGSLPFETENENLLLLHEHICHHNVIYPPNSDSDLKHLIEGMLQKDPQKRSTVADILNHP